MEQALLRLLREGKYVSGEALSRTLGVTRAAVWKHVEALRGQGYDIQAGGKRGYCLVPPPDALMPPFFEAQGCTLHYARELPSTNLRAAELARGGAPQGTLVVAERQTQGRGRRGRDWDSALGVGAWFSLVLRPPVAPAQGQSLPLLMALCVSEACQEVTGINPGIKWPNDLILEGRKLCGILLEMAVEAEQVAWVVAGVGINVGQCATDFPPELQDTAISLSQALGRHVSRGALIQGFVQALWRRWPDFLRDGLPSFTDAYVARSVTLGRMVRVVRVDGAHGDEMEGLAEGLGAQGELLVRDAEGALHHVWAGDVSVRGLTGYAE